MCNIFLHDEFSLDFFSSLSTNEENWIRYFNNFYMPTLLTKTKWVKNANIAFCFNAKMGNNISNYLTNGSCLNCRILNWSLSRGVIIYRPLKVCFLLFHFYWLRF